MSIHLLRIPQPLIPVNHPGGAHKNVFAGSVSAFGSQARPWATLSRGDRRLTIFSLIGRRLSGISNHDGEFQRRSILAGGLSVKTFGKVFVRVQMRGENRPGTLGKF